MSKQILLINITRMGDLVQTGPLIARLKEEWPGAAVDLVVDTKFAPMAAMLPGIRHVHAYDFQRLIDESRTTARDVVALYRNLEAWAKPLAHAGYDRVVNLTFNPRSAFLTRYVGAPDIRGVTVASDGSLLVRNPWLQYFADLHRHRRLNRFNLVDLYALGGSGPGRFAPLTLTIDPAVAEWAKEWMEGEGTRHKAEGKRQKEEGKRQKEEGEGERTAGTRQRAKGKGQEEGERGEGKRYKAKGKGQEEGERGEGKGQTAKGKGQEEGERGEGTRQKAEGKRQKEEGEGEKAEGTRHKADGKRVWIAVQVGASDPIKAWRPASFGLTMAAISRRAPVAFVLIGTEPEADAVHEALAAYHAANGSAPCYDAVGRTTLPQLLALLAECRLLLTNDTGPMHFAVSVGTSVVDLSVGHVDFRETGPYGYGHWVIQPELDCAPCGFDRICAHQACKDRLQPEDVASLCLHALGVGPFPARVSGVRVYASDVDEDGLGCYRLRAGHEDALSDWYGAFWRRFWYEALTGRPSRAPEPLAPEPPDLKTATATFRRLRPQLDQLVAHADRVVRLSGRHPIPAAALKAAQALVAEQRRVAVAAAMTSPAFSPLAVAFLREFQNMDAEGLFLMAQQQAAACRTWSMRVDAAMRALSGGAHRPAHNVAEAMTMCGVTRTVDRLQPGGYHADQIG